MNEISQVGLHQHKGEIVGLREADVGIIEGLGPLEDWQAVAGGRTTDGKGRERLGHGQIGHLPLEGEMEGAV